MLFCGKQVAVRLVKKLLLRSNGDAIKVTLLHATFPKGIKPLFLTAI